MSFYERYLALLKSLYPDAARAVAFEERLSPLLICNEAIELPAGLKAEAEGIVRSFFALRSLHSRARALESVSPPIADPGNTSALMSYDFHVDADGHLRLIEINTNASLSLLVDALHQAHGIVNPFSTDFRAEIVDVFREELAAARTGLPALAGAASTRGARGTLAIVDEDPPAQRLYVEFELYRELFTQAGFDARICDASTLVFDSGTLRFPDAASAAVGLVYNRHTDFYLQTPATKALREAMEARATCITPHPHEYRLLADKERLLELSRAGAIAALELSDEDKNRIQRALIATRELADFGPSEQLWAQRKAWFFKPKRSFGGKATYRGASISKSVFAEVVATGDKYLAQEFVPAPEITLAGGERMKYDLRFFVYRDRIQLGCARLYKGQMTNTQTLGGGAAPIVWRA